MSSQVNASQINAIFPTSFQKSIISGNFNSNILLLFFFGKWLYRVCLSILNDHSGGYLGFYMFTLRIYGTGRCVKHVWGTNYGTAFTSRSTKQTVTFILTALFITTLGQLILVWYSTSICFLGAANSRVDAFILTFGSSSVIGFLFGLTRGVGLIIADALLVGAKLPSKPPTNVA